MHKSFLFRSVLIIVMACFVKQSQGDNIYIMNASGYNTAGPELLAAMTSLGHTLMVNSTNFNSLPQTFVSACIDPINGYHWLCFFGNYDFSPLSADVMTFIADGGKVYYNYEISCCTISAAGAAAMVSAITGLNVTTNSAEAIACVSTSNGGWSANLNGCVNILGNAYKCLDGLPVANQLQASATINGGSPLVTTCENFGYFFTGGDIPGNTMNGSITGMGDINSWYDGDEPWANGGSQPINLALVAYFFPNASTTCHLATAGCSQSCPFVNVLGPNASICDGQSLTLDATSSGAVSYLWDNNSASPTRSITDPGNYWVEISDGNVACTDSITISVVTVNVQASADATTCPGISVTLLASGATSYSWTPAATLNNDAAASPVATPLVTTTYTVVGTSDNCSDSDEVTVTVIADDIQYTISTSPRVCDVSGSVEISDVSGASPPYSLQLDGISISPNIAITVGYGSHSLVVTNALGCLEQSNVFIDDNSYTLNWTAIITDTRCASPGSIEVVDVVGGIAPYTILLNGTPQSDNLISNLTAGNYGLKVSDANGCFSTQSVAIIAQPNAVSASVETTAVFCETLGNVSSVTVTGAMQPFTITIDGNLYNGNNYPLNTQPHTLVVSDADQCTYTTIVQVEDINATEANFTATPHITNAPAIVVFTNTSLNATSYLWSFGEDNTSAEMNEEQQFLEPGHYEISLIAMNDSNGCSDTIKSIVYILPPNSIYVPNAFTPDGDGINDVFRIQGENISQDNFSLTIFNRWGDSIWQSITPDAAWTGSFNQGEYFVSDGIFLYDLRYQFENSVNQLIQTGHILVMR